MTKTTSTYRALLRELPRRQLSSPTPLHQRIRALYRMPLSAQTDPDAAQTELHQRLHEAEQMALYARAQRSYAALVERYNPGMTMDEKEKIRLTARRVGWDLPVEVEEGGKKGEEN